MSQQFVSRASQINEEILFVPKEEMQSYCNTARANLISARRQDKEVNKNAKFNPLIEEIEKAISGHFESLDQTEKEIYAENLGSFISLCFLANLIGKKSSPNSFITIYASSSKNPKVNCFILETAKIIEKHLQLIEETEVEHYCSEITNCISFHMIMGILEMASKT